MASEKTPLIPSSPGGEQTVYFLERRESIRDATPVNMAQQDNEEIETLPDGSTTDQFSARPMTATGRADVINPSSKKPKSWLSFFRNVSRKTNAFAATTSGATSAILPRSAPVKIDPKVFFANERTFLAWLHVSVILAGASVAIVAFTDDSQSSSPGPGALYGVILLPVSIAFILYAMIQYTRRASMIRRKSPGPYMDIAGPTVLTVILMLSIVTQFSIKLYTLM